MIVHRGEQLKHLQIPDSITTREQLRDRRTEAQDMGVRSRLVHRSGRYDLTLVGPPRDVEIALMLFEFLVGMEAR